MTKAPRAYCTRVDATTRQEPTANSLSSQFRDDSRPVTLLEAFRRPEQFAWAVDEDGVIVVKGGRS
jgi:hypothetical protein